MKHILIGFKSVVNQLIRQRGATGVVLLVGLLLASLHLPQPNPVMLAQEPPPKLGAAEIERQLQTLPNWTIANHQLRRTYQFQDFVEAMAFVNRLVEPAESAGHHPDITISYNRVAISLTTHDVGGITQKDFDLAQVIARVAEQL